MKTFFWLDFNYEFIAANAISIEEAREIAIKAVHENRENECKRIYDHCEKLKEDQPEFGEAYDKMYLDFVDRETKEAEYMIKIVTNDEPVELKSGAGKVFDHSNE